MINLDKTHYLLWIFIIGRNYKEQNYNEEGGGGCGNAYVPLPVKQGGPARHEARLPIRMIRRNFGLEFLKNEIQT